MKYNDNSLKFTMLYNFFFTGFDLELSSFILNVGLQTDIRTLLQIFSKVQVTVYSIEKSVKGFKSSVVMGGIWS